MKEYYEVFTDGYITYRNLCLQTQQQTQQTTFKEISFLNPSVLFLCSLARVKIKTLGVYQKICLLPNLLPRPLSCSAFSIAWVQRSNMQSGSGVGKGLETRLP